MSNPTTSSNPTSLWNPYEDETTEVNPAKIRKTQVHIRIQQRSGKKYITTVQGAHLESRDVRDLSRILHCSATTKKDEVHGQIIQIQGDVRSDVSEFLIERGICSEDQIQVHGF
jgi:translation initiation factor 1